MKTIKILAVAAIALIGCGDNKTLPDAKPDATPSAPVLGAQIDRMGRPAVNTALNHGFDPTAAAATAKDAYNQDSNKMTWLQNNVAEFAKNLAIIDVLDTGMCNNAICEASETPASCPADCTYVCPNAMCEGGETNTNCPADCPTAGQMGGSPNGCGNQAAYTPPAGQTSYLTLAGILANDQLFVDPTKSTCSFYLAVEFGIVTTMPTGTCGGRKLDYDVMDFSYSMMAAGLKGFILSTFTPLIGDDVPKHTDYSADFPYLGAPH